MKRRVRTFKRELRFLTNEQKHNARALSRVLSKISKIGGSFWADKLE